MRRIGLLAIGLALTPGCESAVVKARRDLGSEDQARLVAAARVLGKAKDKHSVSRLCELLEHGDPDVRSAMAKALGDIEDGRAAGSLGELYAGEEYTDVADDAARSLIKLGSPSIPVLVPLLRHANPERRAGAARALGKLRTSDAVDGLVRLIDDRDEDVRMAAVHALRQIGDPRGMDAIARALEDPDQDVQDAAGRALGGEGYERELDRAKGLIRRVPGR